jgi:hypothetical protein
LECQQHNWAFSHGGSRTWWLSSPSWETSLPLVLWKSKHAAYPLGIAQSGIPDGKSLPNLLEKVFTGERLSPTSRSRKEGFSMKLWGAAYERKVGDRWKAEIEYFQGAETPAEAAMKFKAAHSYEILRGKLHVVAVSQAVGFFALDDNGDVASADEAPKIIL